jgi:hypothetical protein
MGRDDLPEPPASGRLVLRWAAPYLSVLLVCVLIWLVTSFAAGRPTYFWPVWMLLPLVVGVLGQWVAHRNR